MYVNITLTFLIKNWKVTNIYLYILNYTNSNISRSAVSSKKNCSLESVVGDASHWENFLWRLQKKKKAEEVIKLGEN